MSGVKRPEGFDRSQPAQAPGKGAKPGKAARAGAKSAGAKPVARPRSETAAASRPSRPAVPPKPGRSAAAKSARPAKPQDPVKLAQRRQKAEAAAARKDAARELRAATKERKRYEKAEIRRFTVRARTRRAVVITTLAVVGAMVVLGLVAIFSPILALRTIVVQGTERVDRGAVESALEGQLGTPLALVSNARIDAALAAFPVIQSYSTELVPPGTMVVDIVERQPVVTVQQADGSYSLVDAAGVTVEESDQRVDGVPLVLDATADAGDTSFEAAVQVLLALPDSLRTKVDTIAAKSHDDVTLTLIGKRQSVEWGSPDDSDRKAELLAVLQQRYRNKPGTFDVSAIDDGIFRAG